MDEYESNSTVFSIDRGLLMLLFTLAMIAFLIFSALNREPSSTQTPTRAVVATVPAVAATAPPATAVIQLAQQTAVNGIPASSFIILPPGAVENVRAIYAKGQELGNNPQAYSKVGDSTSVYNFMNSFDEGNYNLASYAYLQETLTTFQGSHSRDGLAVSVGLHAWTALDPAFADKDVCVANESPVACEIRLHRPAFIFIRLGTNDAGVTSLFDSSIR